jgi:hypothetical protein
MTWILLAFVLMDSGATQITPNLTFPDQRSCVETALEIKRDFSPTKVRWTCIQQEVNNGNTVNEH